ncbi:MAG: hypothetical protein EAX91_10590 [Candidatus Lokiarchaeota archaeon]|nr:hypothetical protein [Candidatus Lokiarchaeota archaeon]
MEEINRYLKAEEQVCLERNEYVLWTATKLKRERLRGFWILTNLRWIQNTHISLLSDEIVPFEHLITLFPMRHGTFYLPLKDIKFIFKQDDRKTTYIGYIMNEFIEEWDDEYLLYFGVTLEKSPSIDLFNALTNIFSIGPVIEHMEYTDSYELYPVTLR